MKFRSVGDPVLYLSDPPGFGPTTAAHFLDALGELNQFELQEFGDPEIEARIAQYEMAFRMQTSVPGTDRHSKEPRTRFEIYGEDARSRALSPPIVCWRAGSPSAVSASSSFTIAIGITTAGCQSICRSAARMSIRPSAALIQDLKQRGMLDDTLVIWGGEFGRTVYCQGRLTATDYGRDHHRPLLHDVDGRRRHQTGHHARRDRRLRLQHRAGSGTCPRSAGDDSVLPRASITNASPIVSRAAISG